MLMIYSKVFHAVQQLCSLFRFHCFYHVLFELPFTDIAVLASFGLAIVSLMMMDAKQKCNKNVTIIFVQILVYIHTKLCLHFDRIKQRNPSKVLFEEKLEAIKFISLSAIKTDTFSQ